MIELEKDFTFEAAHFLPNHRAMCGRLHGHSYRLTVKVRGDQLCEAGTSSEGMLIDTFDLSAIVKPILAEKYDHWFLNETLGIVTTTENVVRLLYETIKSKIPMRLELVCTLHEGPTSRASYPVGR